MWLLSTDRAELHFFPSPETVPGGYAALSHVWNHKPGDGPPEQSFKDVKKIQKRCAKDGTNPRDSVSEKIRRCCELATTHGYRWVWIDTCCIDKTSSAELSEAINSMFRYYSLAGICYGYLRDVDTVSFSLEDLEKTRDWHRASYDPRYDPFLHSIWFRRGWTLQELIAPHLFIFLSSAWEVIGTKADLAELLEWDLHIPAAVLRLQASPAEFSIAERMSWFGMWRSTTRPEDEAYCLLGLFEIHMPPLYGEGRNAFRRLQEEIMKQSTDTTLFAWPGHFASSDLSQSLFAESPLEFTSNDRQIVCTPPRRSQVMVDTTDGAAALEATVASTEDMTFAVTPTGMRAYIPIFTWEGEVFADLYWSSREGQRVFLHLEHDPGSQASSFRPPLYWVKAPRLTEIKYSSNHNDVFPPDEPGVTVWKEVLIKYRPPLRRVSGQSPHSAASRFTSAIPMHLTLNAPVRFPEDRIRQFLGDYEMRGLQVHGAGLHSPWTADSNLPTVYVLWGTIIRVGQCQHERLPGEQTRPSVIWATVSSRGEYGRDRWEYEIEKVSTDPRHDCSQDHVLSWPDYRKTFNLKVSPARSSETVTLSFTPCPLNPGRTLIMHASHR